MESTSEPIAATIHRMWYNGGRGLVIIGVASIVTMLLSLATMIWLYWPDSNFEPIYGTAYEVPQEVVETEVKVGQPVNVVGVTKCNGSDKLVASAGTLYWKRLEPSVTYVTGFSGNTTSRVPNECVTSNFENRMPVGVGPGTWQLTGQELIYYGGQLVQTLSWETQSFVVVE